MSKLIYAAIASLDGFIEDGTGKFDWAMPSDEVHAFVNDRERQAGIYLYGRRMYETMAGWETDPRLVEASPLMRDYAKIWQAADKIVFSTTLAEAITARTRLKREFDPEEIRQMLAFAECDFSVGGANLAAQAFQAGLVDECRLYLVPILVGGGKKALPAHLRLKLELLDERRFGNGTVYLHYRVRR
jgi:dihydrofolate reductase